MHRSIPMLLAAACAAATAGTALAGAPLRTFDATQLTPDRYTIVRRVWVDSPRSAFFVPWHEDSAAALAELSAEAAEAGADALTNVVCLADRRAKFQPGYFCYGLAIRLK